jgi:heterodisulfide reductase subunit D
MKVPAYESLSHFWSEKKQEFINGCTLCGDCMEVCPVIGYTDYAQDEPTHAMERFLAFLECGSDVEAAHNFMQACCSCALCGEVCPLGCRLHLTVKDFVVTDLRKAGYPVKVQGESELPEDPKGVYRVFAAIQPKPVDRYKRWLVKMPTDPPQVDTIYFPSCSSPGLTKRLFDMLDIFEMTGLEYLALSSHDLDLCCGCMHIKHGYMEKAEQRARSLVTALSAFRPRMVVTGCPWTYYWLHNFVPEFCPYDFEVQHQVQFIADNLERLDFRQMEQVVAYHDSCSIGRWAGEFERPRKILRHMPGVTFVEMERKRTEAACCGAAAPKELRTKMVNDSLAEVSTTGAEVLTSICAGCVMNFQQYAASYGLDVMNIISFVAESLGSSNEDTLQKCMQYGNVDRVIEATHSNIERSEFTVEEIRPLISRYLFAGGTLGGYE